MASSTSFAEGIKQFFKSTKEVNKELAETDQSTSPVAEPNTPITSDKSSSDVYILLNSSQCHKLNLTDGRGSFFNSSAIKTEPSDEVIIIDSDSDSDTEMPMKNIEHSPSHVTNNSDETLESVTQFPSKSTITMQSECDTTTLMDDDDVIIIDELENTVHHPTVKVSPSQTIENSIDETPESVSPFTGDFVSNSKSEEFVRSSVMTEDVSFADNSEPVQSPTEKDTESAQNPTEVDSEYMSYYPNEHESGYELYPANEDSESMLPAHSIFEPDITFFEESEDIKIDEENCIDQILTSAEVCEKCGKPVSTANGEPNHCSCNSSSFPNVQVSSEIDSNTKGTGNENSIQICGFCKKEIRGSMQYHCEFRCPATETWRLLCNICSDSFGTPNGLVNHVQVVHDTNITVEDALQSQRIKNSPSSKEEKSNACPYCYKELRDKHSLRIHCEFRCKATETYRLVCNICSQGMAGQNSLVIHYRTKHKLEITHKMANNAKRVKTSECLQTPRNSKENKTCALCKRSFSYITAYNDHCDFQCPKREKFKLLCHICSNPLSGPTSLQLHLQRLHKIKANRSFILSVSKKVRSDEINSDEEYLPKPTKPLYCLHCNKEFPSHVKKGLQIHIDFQCAANNETFELICEVCSDSFAGPRSLKNHMLKAHDISVTLTKAACAVKIKSKRKSKEQIQMASKVSGNTANNSEKPNVSDSCAESKSSDLAKSDVTRRSEKLFQSADDSVDILNNSDVEANRNNDRHGINSDGNSQASRNLTKRKPVKNNSTAQNLRAAKLLNFFEQSGFKSSSCVCPICGKYVYSSSFLKIHMRRHTNEKPFRCMKCGMSFITKIAMKYHAIVKCPKRKVIRGRTNSFQNGFQTDSHKRKYVSEQNEGRSFKKSSLKNCVRQSTDETDVDSVSSSDKESSVQYTGKSNSQKLSRKQESRRAGKDSDDDRVSRRKSSKEAFSTRKQLNIKHSSEKDTLPNTKTYLHGRNRKLSKHKHLEKRDSSSSGQSDSKLMSYDSSNEETDSRPAKLSRVNKKQQHSRENKRKFSGKKRNSEPLKNFRSQKNIQDKNNFFYDKRTSEMSDYSSSDENAENTMTCDSRSTKSYSPRRHGKSLVTTSHSSMFIERKRLSKSGLPEYSCGVDTDMFTGKNLHAGRSSKQALLKNRDYSSTDEGDNGLSTDSFDDDGSSKTKVGKLKSLRKSRKSLSKSASFSGKYDGNKRHVNKLENNSYNTSDSDSKSENEVLIGGRQKKLRSLKNHVDNSRYKKLPNQKSRRSSNKLELKSVDSSSTDESDCEMISDNSHNETSSQSKSYIESQRTSKKSGSKTTNISNKFEGSKRCTENNYCEEDLNYNTNPSRESLTDEKQKQFRCSNRKSVDRLVTDKLSSKRVPVQRSGKKSDLRNSNYSSTVENDKELVSDDESIISTTKPESLRKSKKSLTKSTSLSRTGDGNKRSMNELEKDSNNTRDTETNSEKEELTEERQIKYRRLNNQVDNSTGKKLPDQKSRKSSRKFALRSCDDLSTDESDNSRNKKLLYEKSIKSSRKPTLKISDDSSIDENDNTTNKKLPDQKSRRPSIRPLLKSSDDSSSDENDNPNKEASSHQSKEILKSHRESMKSGSNDTRLSGIIEGDGRSSKTNFREENTNTTKVSETNVSKETVTEEKEKLSRRSNRKSVQPDKFKPITATKNLPERKVKRTCTKVAGLYRECSSTDESDLEFSSDSDTEEDASHSDKKRNNKRRAEANHSEDESTEFSNSELNSRKESLTVGRQKNVKCSYCGRSFKAQGIFRHEHSCKKKNIRKNNNNKNNAKSQTTDRDDRSDGASSSDDSSSKRQSNNFKKSSKSNSQYDKASEKDDISSQDNKKSDELEAAKINLKSQQFAVLCGICDAESRWPSAMKTHSLRYHDKFDLICKTCSGRFIDYDGLISHLKVNGRSYYCDNYHSSQAEVIVISDDSSDDHNSDNDGDGKNIFKCNSCTKKYPSIAALINHLGQHLSKE